jgi:hypothetical protein
MLFPFPALTKNSYGVDLPAASALNLVLRFSILKSTLGGLLETEKFLISFDRISRREGYSVHETMYICCSMELIRITLWIRS